MRSRIIPMLVVAFLAVSPSLFAQSFEHGQFQVGPTTEGWNLNDGNGQRSVAIMVLFDKPFESAPTVTLGVTGFDISNQYGVRLSVKVEKVTIAGFVIRVTTWADSRIFSVNGDWFAYGK
jgi:hypothetical protein